MKTRCIAALASILVAAATVSSAEAIFAFTETDTGAETGIVGILSGSLDIEGLTPASPGASHGNDGIYASASFIMGTAGDSAMFDGYLVGGPTVFGLGPVVTTGIEYAGTDIFLWGANSTLFLPQGYSSGQPLSGTMTIAGRDFASLGISSSEVAYTLQSGDQVRVSFAAAPVPLPSGLVLLLGGIGLAAAALRRR